MGKYAGGTVSGGTDSVYIGCGAGKSNVSGNQNVAIGFHANADGSGGTSGVFLGNCSGRCMKGTSNIAVGAGALLGSSSVGTNTGGYNIAIGCLSGCKMSSGTYNVFAGQYAGLSLIHI